MKINTAGLRELFFPQQNIAADSASSQPDVKVPAGLGQDAAGDRKPDRLELSDQARAAFASELAKAKEQTGAKDQAGGVSTPENRSLPDNGTKSPTNSGSSPAKSTNPSGLTNQEKMVVSRLQSRDVEVRTHEAQHIAAAGGYARGGPQYDLQDGPDGKQYAVGGHVNLDVSPIANNPEATISKAQTIQHAALAPADPSGADRAVAAAAGKMEMEARAELSEKNQEKLTKSTGGVNQTTTTDNTAAASQTASANSKESGASSRPSQSSQKPVPNSPPGKFLNLLA